MAKNNTNMIKKYDKKFGFNYNQLNIIPRRPTINIESVNISTCLTSKIKITLPIISSPMDSVTGRIMAIKLAKLGGLGIIHNNFPSITKQAEEVYKVKSTRGESNKSSTDSRGYLRVGALISNCVEDRKSIYMLIKAGVDIIAIDSLHSDPDQEVEAIKYIKKNFPKVEIMSGNVVCPEDIKILSKLGVSCIRVGISAGSINRTRLLTGIGRAQGISVFECAREAKKYNIPIVADGGIQNTGDIAIALALGASAVMMGKMFAATKESQGLSSKVSGRVIKKYWGMSTKNVIRNRKIINSYGQFQEGAESIVDTIIPLSILTKNIEESLRIAFYRSSSKSMKEFHSKSILEING